MTTQHEVLEDIIADLPDENSSEEIEGSDSDNQEQNDQSLSEFQRPYKPLNDLGNVERFVDQHSDLVRYCPGLDRWLVYDGSRWVQDSGKTTFLMVKDTINSIREEAERDGLSAEDKRNIIAHADKSSSKGRIKAVLDLAKWEDGITVAVNQLDANPWLLNCKNGTLNLKTKELQPHNSADLITKMVQVPYDPDARCPEWDGFFSQIMDNDQDKIEFLRRSFGYALTGEINEQCLFVFHGPGANGKSTLTEIFRDLLGPYAMHTTSDSLLHSKSSPIRNDIARLNGARFVSAVEIGMGKKLDESLIKQLTGGDQVTARFLYNEYFEYKPGFKLFIAANHRPEIRGTDNGIWRRIHLVPFNMTIGSDEIDKDLPQKLRQELPGILAWTVRGCYEWQRQGLNPPESIQAATADYRAEMDLLESFIDDKCIRQSSDKVPVGDLYEAYKGWTDFACQETVGKKIFGNLMRQKGFFQSKSGNIRYWNGIKLNPEENSEEEK
jgi:putative DNA primase/helicase